VGGLGHIKGKEKGRKRERKCVVAHPLSFPIFPHITPQIF